MGLFDDLVNAAKDAAHSINESMENARKERGSGCSNYNNPPPALPAKPIQTSVNNHNVQFMLSQDFIEEPGFASSVISFKYCPAGFENEYNAIIDDDGNKSYRVFSISIETCPTELFEIDELINNYINTGDSIGARDFVEFEDGIYLFKACIETYGYLEHIYVLRNDNEDTEDYSFLLLNYEKEIQGTPLEQKLIACFNGVANSLTLS